MEEATSSNTVLLIFLFVVLFFICLDLLSPKKLINESSVNQANRELDEKIREQEEFEKLQKRLRSTYWNNLGSIYDNLNTDILLKAKDILQNMIKYHNHEGAINDHNIHNIDLWYSELAELRIMLNYPSWVDSSNDESYNMPLFEDLDIRYIDDTINIRNNRPKRNYSERSQ